MKAPVFDGDLDHSKVEHGSEDRLSAWNTRLIEVITDCEDDTQRYRDAIGRIDGIETLNGDENIATVLAWCMADTNAHRHLALFTALHIVEMRFCQAGCAVAETDNSLSHVGAQLRGHIELIGLMMRAMLSHSLQVLKQGDGAWDYGGSLLSHLVERRLGMAIDEAVALLHQHFSCTLVTVLMAAIEPAMKSVQDRLSLRPELPLDVKAFAGAMLGLKCNCRYDARIDLADLASDISQIFKIPRTICLSA